MENPDTSLRRKRGRGRTRYIPVSVVPASSSSSPNPDEKEVSELATRFAQSVGIGVDDKALALRRVASENAREPKRKHWVGEEGPMGRLERWFGGTRRGKVIVVEEGHKWLVVFRTCADARSAMREFKMEGYEINRISTADEETQRVFTEHLGQKGKAGGRQTSDVVARRMIFDALGMGQGNRSDPKIGNKSGDGRNYGARKRKTRNEAESDMPNSIQGNARGPSSLTGEGSPCEVNASRI